VEKGERGYLILRFGGSLDLVNHWYESSHLLSWEGLQLGGRDLSILDVKHSLKLEVWWLVAWTGMGLSLNPALTS
jgi:hypothetical protein